MKKLILIIALVAVILPACKTTEANYRAAYEIAKQKEKAGIDSTVYAKIRQEARPHQVVVGGDTIAMKAEYVTLVPDMDQNSDLFLQYNVVTGQFKQLFTAKDMRKRLINNGFADAIVIQTREPLYYVVAVSVATPAEAAEALKKVRESSFPTRDPFPWILKRP